MFFIKTLNGIFTLILLCVSCLWIISFPEFLEEGVVQGSFSNFTEFTLLLFSCNVKQHGSFLSENSQLLSEPSLFFLFWSSNFPCSAQFWCYYGIQFCFPSVQYPVLVEISSSFISRILWSQIVLSCLYNEHTVLGWY